MRSTPPSWTIGTSLASTSTQARRGSGSRTASSGERATHLTSRRWARGFRPAKRSSSTHTWSASRRLPRRGTRSSRATAPRPPATSPSIACLDKRWRVRARPTTSDSKSSCTTTSVILGPQRSAPGSASGGRVRPTGASTTSRIPRLRHPSQSLRTNRYRRKVTCWSKGRSLVVVVAGLIVAGALVAAAMASAKTSVVALRPTVTGKVLVAANGRTLYMFTADRRNVSNCYGQCTLLATANRDQAVRGHGLARVHPGTTKRNDGKLQVTYGGHPLYLFIKDTKAGDTKGQGFVHFGGAWWVVSAAGRAITTEK